MVNGIVHVDRLEQRETKCVELTDGFLGIAGL